jgi:hypothetical protein
MTPGNGCSAWFSNGNGVTGDLPHRDRGGGGYAPEQVFSA